MRRRVSVEDAGLLRRYVALCFGWTVTDVSEG